MKEKKLILTFFLLAWFLLAANSQAQTLIISGNASSSANNLVINSGSVVNITQSNFADVVNAISATASSGNNNQSVSESPQNTTGETLINVSVRNLLNQNLSRSDCCHSPTPVPSRAPSPTPTPAPVPTSPPVVILPTQPPSISVVSSVSSSRPADPQSTPVGGAPVLGLSQTSSESNPSLPTLASALCFALAALIVKSAFRA